MAIKNFDIWIAAKGADADIFRKFYIKLSNEQLSTASRGTYLHNLNRVLITARTVSPDIDFRNLTLDSVEEIVFAIGQKYGEGPGKKAQKHTVFSLKMALRKYCELCGPGTLDERHHLRDAIKVKAIPKEETKEHDELITRSELDQMIKACPHPRDAALIALLYDTGGRIGEILALNLENVKFEDVGARITFTSDTTKGKRKRVNLVVFAAPYLHTWINSHEHRDTPSAPLFYAKNSPLVGNMERKGQKAAKDMLLLPNGRIVLRLTDGSARRYIQKIAKNAGVTKRIHPHLFRHTRATELASNNTMNEATLNKKFGWKPTSGMAAIYVNMHDNAADDAILTEAGMTIEAKEGTKYIPKRCNVCDALNDANADFCVRCHRPISAKEIARIEAERVEQSDLAALKAELDALRAELHGRSSIESQIRAEYDRTHFEVSDTGERRFIATDEERGDILSIVGKLQAAGYTGDEFKKAFDKELNAHVKRVVSDAADIVIAERKKQAFDKIV